MSYPKAKRILCCLLVVLLSGCTTGMLKGRERVREQVAQAQGESLREALVRSEATEEVLPLDETSTLVVTTRRYRKFIATLLRFARDRKLPVEVRIATSHKIPNGKKSIVTYRWVPIDWPKEGRRDFWVYTDPLTGNRAPFGFVPPKASDSLAAERVDAWRIPGEIERVPVEVLTSDEMKTRRTIVHHARPQPFVFKTPYLPPIGRLQPPPEGMKDPAKWTFTPFADRGLANQFTAAVSTFASWPGSQGEAYLKLGYYLVGYQGLCVQQGGHPLMYIAMLEPPKSKRGTGVNSEFPVPTDIRRYPFDPLTGHITRVTADNLVPGWYDINRVPTWIFAAPEIYVSCDDGKTPFVAEVKHREARKTHSGHRASILVPQVDYMPGRRITELFRKDQFIGDKTGRLTRRIRDRAMALRQLMLSPGNHVDWDGAFSFEGGIVVESKTRSIYLRRDSTDVDYFQAAMLVESMTEKDRPDLSDRYWRFESRPEWVGIISVPDQVQKTYEEKVIRYPGSQRFFRLDLETLRTGWWAGVVPHPLGEEGPYREYIRLPKVDKCWPILKTQYKQMPTTSLSRDFVRPLGGKAPIPSQGSASDSPGYNQWIGLVCDDGVVYDNLFRLTGTTGAEKPPIDSMDLATPYKTIARQAFDHRGPNGGMARYFDDQWMVVGYAPPESNQSNCQVTMYVLRKPRREELARGMVTKIQDYLTKGYAHENEIYVPVYQDNLYLCPDR
ncbi:MAG: hypothetical protein D6794_03390 [Deltaproteobacteria bacterium]|nr:MAG: hypothetical protein D6794_03390 [Deltaproteobacteria bacterium]